MVGKGRSGRMGTREQRRGWTERRRRVERRRCERKRRRRRRKKGRRRRRRRAKGAQKAGVPGGIREGRCQGHGRGRRAGLSGLLAVL